MKYSARAAVSRADLLQVLVAQDKDTAARMAALLQFVPKPVNAPIVPQSQKESQNTPQTNQLPAAPNRPEREPLQAVFRDVLAITDSPPNTQSSDTVLATDTAPPLTAADCQPRQPNGAAPWQALTRPLPLAAALRPAVQQARPAGLDVRRLVADLARAHLPAQLPRVTRGRWPQTLWVVLDRSERLQPYQRDFDGLLDQLQRLGGGLQIHVGAVQDTPPHAWLKLPGLAHAQCLILSDVGTLAGHLGLQNAWLDWARQLRRRGGAAQVWLPHQGRQLLPAWHDLLPVHSLQAARPGQRVRAGAEHAAQRQTQRAHLDALLQRLLVRASCCVHLDTDLLRALRLGDDALRHEPALEALYWSHAHVERSRISRPIAPQHAPAWRAELAQRYSADERLALWRALYQAHAWRGRSTEVAEVLLWHTHGGRGLENQTDFQQARQAAENWLAKLETSATHAAQQRLGSASELRAFAADWLGRQWHDQSWQQRHSRALSMVWVSSGTEQAPPGLQPDDLQQAQQRIHSERQAAPACVLLEKSDGLWLWPLDTLAQAQGFALTATPDAVLQGDLLVGAEAAAAEPLQWRKLHTQQAPLQLAQAHEPWPREVWGAKRRLTLGQVARPRWAQSFWRDRHGLHANFAHPWGEGRALHTVGAWLLDEASARRGFWLDKFGLCWDLDCHGVTQRLRYIAPGSFWMGSTLAEQEAAAQGNTDALKWMKGESPVHHVTLTEGFWLADTACTQALWLAVAGGDNPSKFKGDAQCPVEQVSWDDVTEKFLPKLQALLPPGCEATLPTEAQWEYACRAGTTTPFSFCDNINPSLVNYDGNNPYNGGEKGEYRRHTVPVKTLPANPWGLYEIHGNVWEWCGDEQRDYAEGAVVDPIGAIGDGPRLLRGGSWYDLARLARSVYRDRAPRDARASDIGFRVALRFKPLEPQAQDQQAKPASSLQNQALLGQQTSHPQQLNPSHK
jgi:formylglycine-generating enzyme required for sulfatase activity